MTKKCLPNYKHELEITAEFRPGYFFMKSFSFLDEEGKMDFTFRTAVEYLEALDDSLPSSVLVSLPSFEDYERDTPLSSTLGTYELGFIFTIIVFAEDITDLFRDTQKTIECIRTLAKEKHAEIYNIYLQEPSRPILIQGRKDAYAMRKSLQKKLKIGKQ